MKKYLLILLLISSTCYGQLTTGTQRVSVTTDQSGHVISTPLVFSNQVNMIVAASNQQELVRYLEFTNGLAGITASSGITNVYNTGAGTGLVFQVSSQVARIASLLPAGSITLSSSGGTNITITGLGITNSFNASSGTNLISSVSGLNINLKTVTPGSNITITDQGTNLVIAATSAATGITNAFPASSGTNLISSVASGNINLKTITPGSNITITDQGTNLVIAATAAATGITNVVVTSPIGSNIVQSVANSVATLKSLSPGNNITITEGVSNLVLSTTADALGITNVYNVGTGTGFVASVSSRVANIMTLVPGPGITITNSGNTNLTIAATASGSSALSLIHLQDRRTSSTVGGTATTGSWKTRTLTNLIVDTGGLVVAFTTNTFALGPGTYRARGAGVFYATSQSRNRLHNITSNSVSCLGECVQANAGGNGSCGAPFFGRFVVVAGTTNNFQLQYFTVATTSTQDLGPPVTSGDDEVYADVWIEKE